MLHRITIQFAHALHHVDHLVDMVAHPHWPTALILTASAILTHTTEH